DTGAVERRQVVTDLLDDPLVQLHDHAGLFGGIDQVLGGEKTAASVADAQQRFVVAYFVVGDVEDRLEVHLQAIAGQGFAHPLFPVDPLVDALAVLVITTADVPGVAALRLRLVHGDVGIGQQRFNGFAIARADADTDAGGDGQ